MPPRPSENLTLPTDLPLHGTSVRRCDPLYIVTAFADLGIRGGERATSLSAPPLIAPSGELDITSVESFRTAVEEVWRNGSSGIVIDLTAVSFIDSTGLGAVIELHGRFREQQRELCVVAPAGSAAAVLFARTGFARHLRIFDSAQAAITSLAG